MIERVVSGGQTGADQGGLDAALLFWGEDVTRVGGWCPSGRRSEDGPIPAKYPLTETAEWDYPTRTKLNIKDSCGTVVFTQGEPSGGSKLTLDHAAKSRAFLHIDVEFVTKAEAVEMIADWADSTQISVLNVAGSRETSCPGIQEWVADVIYSVLLEIGAAP